jgi:hypothetical protein
MNVGDVYWKPITRTSSLTFGSVTAVAATVAVGYGADGTITHKDCSIFTAMSAGGESGSWCARLHTGSQDEASVRLDANRHPGVYLFAGSSTSMICHDILGAMNAMGIQPYVPSTPPTPDYTMTIDFNMVKTAVPNRWIVKGVAKDSITAQPISGATVALGNLTVSTDSYGSYSFSNVVPGNYNIGCSAEGYDTQTKQITLPQSLSLLDKIWRIF